MNRIHIRFGKLLFAMMCIAGVIFILNAITRSLIVKNTEAIVFNNGKFGKEAVIEVEAPADGEDPQGLQAADPGFSDKVFEKERISQGYLTPNPDSKEIDVTAVELYGSSNEFYGVADGSMMLNERAVDALNLMMEGYYQATALNDFVVYGTNDTYTGEGSICPKKYADSVSMNTIDVALMAYDSMISYDGLDAEGWLIDNCMKYGFIVRYPEGKSAATGEAYCPWHLRYVGVHHALFMTANNMCLEEYVEYLRNFTRENPCAITVGNDVYNVFYVPSNGDKTEISLPMRGNYDVSGNNSDGFIVSYKVESNN